MNGSWEAGHLGTVSFGHAKSAHLTRQVIYEALVQIT